MFLAPVGVVGRAVAVHGLVRAPVDTRIRLLISNDAAWSHHDRSRHGLFYKTAGHLLRAKGRGLADVNGNHAWWLGGREHASLELGMLLVHITCARRKKRFR